MTIFTTVDMEAVEMEIKKSDFIVERPPPIKETPKPYYLPTPTAAGVEAMINSKLDQTRKKIQYHSEKFRYYKKMDRGFNIPLIIGQAILSSTIIVNTTQLEPLREVLLFTAILSSLIFVASSLGKYLGWNDRYHQHDICIKIYQRLLDTAALRLLKNHLTKEQKEDILYDMVTSMDTIAIFEID